MERTEPEQQPQHPANQATKPEPHRQRFDFANQANAEYIDRLYQQYQRDPRTVDETWRAYFAGFEFALGRAPDATVLGAGGVVVETPRRQPLTIGVYNLVHSYRELGHFVARLDPLGHDRPNHPLLDLSQFGMTPTDLDLQVGTGGFVGPTEGTLGDLLEKLRATYTGTLGVEFMDISDKAQRDWLTHRMEPILNRPAYSPEQARSILYQIVAAEEFERFLHTRYVGQKRFSLEGAESLIPLLNTLVDEAALLGAEEVCMGMAHRGRLNVLAHVLNKPYEVIFSEFEGTIVTQDSEGDGDVKYHLGYANDRPTPTGRPIHLSLSPNPSHLELIDPVVEGIVRCKQKNRGDKDHSRVVPVLLHGDAAFTGQGIVHETLGLSELPFYRTGGTIHVIVNNQIGFTTAPHEGRFTPYPTDVAKMIQAPIFHVNGDDPDAVVHAAKLAIAFRQQFKCDVFLDLWCYRKHGHNEVDEPGYTQPVMYREIAEKRSVRELFSEKLKKEAKVDDAVLQEMRTIARERMEQAGNLAREYRPRARTAAFNPLWRSMSRTGDWNSNTAVPRETLLKVAEGVARLPDDFTLHPKLKKLLPGRLEAVREGKGIDWGNGEMLALGSLLLEGTPVRFTGQDVQRGTFSHRQAVLYDYNTGKPHTPLNFIATAAEASGNGNGQVQSDRFVMVPGGHSGHGHPGQAHLTIVNTMLSELATIGFEYGFSSADPRNLVVWEAQFGDFVNGAQPIIDQFIAAAESKWGLMNGLVMLLPHGYEGQGPEHSNAYLERFLSLCAEDNMQVCVPTTPAQYFHLLRRQIHRRFRKPLILMMPKSLLRHEPSSSRIEEFTQAGLQLAIDDPTAPERDSVRRVLLCSGKVYYTLAQAREREGVKDVAIVRVEQLYPFPQKEIQSILSRYRRVQEVSWVQEEPKNRGGWSFVEPRLRAMLPDAVATSYYGRDESASPATGSYKMHQIEEQEIVAHALDLKAKAEPPKPEQSKGEQPKAAQPPVTEGVKQIAAAVPATASSQTSASE